MEKTEAQKKNEKEVQRIMKERGYNDFWGEETKKNTSPAKTKKIIVGLLFVITPVIGLSGGFITMYINHQKEQTKELLSSCLSEAVRVYSATAEKGATEAGMYQSQIECHEKYKTDNYEQRVAQLTEDKTESELNTCLAEADKNYAVSDEEINNAGTDISASLILIKRIGAGIDAKMNCHYKYKTSYSESELNKLKADKSENEAYIQDAENALEAQKYRSSSRRSINCSSYSHGNSTYTDCY